MSFGLKIGCIDEKKNKEKAYLIWAQDASLRDPALSFASYSSQRLHGRCSGCDGTWSLFIIIVRGEILLEARKIYKS